jgi:hypothetical protein
MAFATPEINATVNARLALQKNRPQPVQVIWSERGVRYPGSRAPCQTDEMRIVTIGDCGVLQNAFYEMGALRGRPEDAWKGCWRL